MKQPRTKPAPSPRADRAPRQRAGQRLKRPPARAGEAPTQEETARLLHELQVHQVELEMQNEELTAARAELEAGRARYADLYDFAPTAYLTLDREGSIRQTNLAGARLLGGERARVVNRRLSLFMAPGDRQAFNDFLQRAFASGTGQSCEITLSGPGAEPVVVRVEGARSADGQECRIVLVDITEGRQAMAGVRASEAALSGIFNLAAVGIAQADPQTGRWLRVNRKMCEITGYSEGELLQMRIVEITHPDDWSRDLEEFQRVVRGEAPSYRLEKRYLRADGAVIWVNVNMMVIRDASGQPERTVATIEDITERKAAEAQAHLQTSRLGLALDAAEMVTWELDLATGRLSYSDNLLRMSGRVDAAPYVTLDAFVQQLHPDDQARATAALERAVQAGEPFECDYRVRVADGSWHWLLGKGKGVAGPDGQVVQVLGVSFDITARRLAEEQAQRWQRVFDNAEFGLAYANVADNTLLEVNGAFARQRGYTQAEMVGAPIGRFYAPEARAEMQQRIQDIDRLGHLVFEAIHQRKDGTSFPVLVEVTTIKDQQGRPVSRVVYAVDITERNQVMAAKQKAQALNQAIIESIPGSFFMLDEQGRFLRWNAHERDEILGLPDDQILGTDALETVHPQEREELRSKLAAVLADGGVRTAECRRRIRGGPAERWFLMTGRRMLIEGRPCLIGIGVDITERKRIEAALIEAQRLAKVGSWESGAKPGTFIWSDELYRIYGRDPALGSTDFQGVSAYLSPASQAALGAAKEQALRQGIPYECDAEVIRPDGTRRWVTSRGEPMRDAQGNITGLRGTTQDITERKQVEASLREERLRLAAIIEATHVGTWEWNLQTGQTTLNERWAEIIGYALADLAPTSFATWEKFTHPDDLQTCNALLERHIQGELDYYECEARMRHRDGHWVWVLDRGKVTSWADDGKPLLMQGTHTDITGRKQTELERERLNQELETKNREFQNVLYAASHDLRSPMLNVQGFSRQLDQVCHELAGLLDASTGSHPDPQAALQIVRARIPRALEFIGSSVEKMDVLINGMLRLSRLGQVVLRRQALDMNQLLQQIAATMMIQIQTANAALRIEPLPGCSGDLMLINQVFSNLLDNALKYREPSRPLVIRVTGRQVGAETHYCVADNGQGIAGGQVDRIWNLFCRLDPSGPPGEGLGLNLVRRIVERHDGRVWAESTLHEGSQFFVALPAAMAEPPATDFAK